MTETTKAAFMAARNRPTWQEKERQERPWQSGPQARERAYCAPPAPLIGPGTYDQYKELLKREPDWNPGLKPARDERYLDWFDFVEPCVSNRT
ncbi:MAG: hypothetical protein AAF862_05260 [Pseudomonadota bacterium]